MVASNDIAKLYRKVVTELHFPMEVLQPFLGSGVHQASNRKE